MYIYIFSYYTINWYDAYKIGYTYFIIYILNCQFKSDKLLMNH